MATAAVLRNDLHRMIEYLPEYRTAMLFDFARFLQDEDDEPLSCDELLQIAQADEDIAAGRVSPWEEVKAYLSTTS